MDGEDVLDGPISSALAARVDSDDDVVRGAGDVGLQHEEVPGLVAHADHVLVECTTFSAKNVFSVPCSGFWHLR